MININKDLDVISLQTCLIEHTINQSVIEEVCKNRSCSYLLNICIITLCTRYTNLLPKYLGEVADIISKCYNTATWVIYHYLMYSLCPGELNTTLLSPYYIVDNFEEIDDDLWYIRMCDILSYLSFWMAAPDDNIEDVRSCVKYVKDNTGKYNKIKESFYEKDLFDDQ